MFEPSRLDWAKDFVGEPLKAAGAKPYTLEHLAGWIAEQDPEAKYDYTTVRGCLIGQYTLAMGGEVGGDYFLNGKLALCSHPLRPDLWAVASPHPQTMGAALTRAQAALERLS